MLTPEEQDIIKGIKEGGKSRQLSESRLYLLFKDLIDWGTYNYKISKEDSEEAYNDAIRALIKTLEWGTYDEKQDTLFISYVLKIYRNKCIDRTRIKLVKAEELQQSTAEKLPDQIKTTILDLIAKKELRKRLDDCYEKQGESCKKLLNYVEQEYGDKEIARLMLYKSADVAKQKRYRCRDRLAECLNLQKDE